ncbi:YcaO-like family protein [Kineococcus gynurae]|uniref:YcaO-like family protein n=1 Tax=Kineococcus gynurae TaxID=452979 RepID=A0ABV5LTM3_9ACTN
MSGSEPGIAERYRAALPPGDVHEVDLTGFDRTGVPVVATVWRPEPGSATSGHGVGYGAREVEARIGAYGELAEQVLLDAALARQVPVEGSRAELVLARGEAGVVDPRRLVLPAGAPVDPDRPLRWLPMRRWESGEEVLVPAECVAPHAAGIRGGPPAGGWLVTPITNGMGAGDTLERAVLHGLGELLQRDGNTVSFRALEQGTVVTGVDEDPVTADVLARLQAAGLDVTVRLASTEFATVVHAVAEEDPTTADPMVLGAVGEAADPDAARAVRKALLELASSRARRAFAFGPLERLRDLAPEYLAAELAAPLPPQEERALRAMTAWTRLSGPEMADRLAPLHRRTATVALADLPRSAPVDVPTGLAATLDRLAGFDVLVAARTVEGPLGPVAVAKVVVPGLEVETLSYARIGERVAARLLDRGSDLVGRGAPDRPGREPVRLTPEAEERLGGPVWFDVAAAEREVGELYPLYREPTRHAPHR